MYDRRRAIPFGDELNFNANGPGECGISFLLSLSRVRYTSHNQFRNLRSLFGYVIPRFDGTRVPGLRGLEAPYGTDRIPSQTTTKA